MDERRAYKRFSIALPIEYKFAAFQNEGTRTSALDISGSGLRFRAKDRPVVGEEVHLMIDLPSSGTVLLAAKPVWIKFIPETQEYEIGVKLAETKSEDKKRFMDFYSQQMFLFLEKNKDTGKIQ